MTTKALLVTDLSLELGITKKFAKDILETISGLILVNLQDDGQALIPGIGKLKLKQRSARTGRNPRTGEALTIPARQTVRLAATKSLKDHVTSLG